MKKECPRRTRSTAAAAMCNQSQYYCHDDINTFRLNSLKIKWNLNLYKWNEVYWMQMKKFEGNKATVKELMLCPKRRILLFTTKLTISGKFGHIYSCSLTAYCATVFCMIPY